MKKHIDYLILKHDKQLAVLNQLLKRLSNYRFIAFLFVVITMFLTFQDQWFSIAVLISVAVFIFFVKRYQKFEKRKIYLIAKQNYYKTNSDRISNKWQTFNLTESSAKLKLNQAS